MERICPVQALSLQRIECDKPLPIVGDDSDRKEVGCLAVNSALELFGKRKGNECPISTITYLEETESKKAEDIKAVARIWQQ